MLEQKIKRMNPTTQFTIMLSTHGVQLCLKEYIKPETCFVFHVLTGNNFETNNAFTLYPLFAP